MKKLFSSNQQSSHVGKTFNVGRYSLNVEEVIAEGKMLLRGVIRCFFIRLFMATNLF